MVDWTCPTSSSTPSSVALALVDRVGSAFLDPMLGLGADPRHLDLRPLANAGDVLVDALPERGSLVGRLGPDGLDPRGSLGLEASRRLGAACERRLAHGLDQARDERVSRRGRAAPRLSAAAGGGSAAWAASASLIRRGPDPVAGCALDAVLHGIGVDHLGLGTVFGHIERVRCGVRGHGWLALGAMERVPRRVRRPPRPGRSRASPGQRSQRRTPRRRRARRPTGGENHASVDLTSLNVSSGRDGPAHSGAGRRGWSWCSRVWGSALVVPGGSARRYRVGATPGGVDRARGACRPRADRRLLEPALPFAPCSSRGQPRLRRTGRASSTGSAGRCATSGSRSPTGATSAARTACRRRSSGATTSSCPGTRSCATRRSTGWRGVSSASASASCGSPAASRRSGAACRTSWRCSPSCGRPTASPWISP